MVRALSPSSPASRQANRGTRTVVGAAVAAALLSAGLLVLPGTAFADAVLPTPAPSGGEQTVRVSDGKGLKAALAAALPGQTIELADGAYSGNFKITAGGTASAPITLTGSRNAVLSTPSGGGNGIQLTSAPYWTISGITLTGGQKGIMVDSSDHVVVDAVEVHRTTMEGIHFRTSSSYGVVRNSFVHDTGTSRNGMGEGVYVGTANTLTDASDHVQIIDNRIGPNVGGENIDIKEGTTGGLISGNTFDGSGLTGANYDDSWVDVKGNGYTIENNRGIRTTNDGYQTHSQFPGWGCGTVFRNNASDLTGSPGPDRYAINITNYDPAACPATVTSDNSVTGGRGLVNPGVPVT
ncbi:NosD domain-containing protein [Streptomyces sp. NPDC052043]|uniref:NosD domain-containing protein n=1 Tax=Streptomyces sp. NPDC052043 TaxID=3365684 RepID=UPI0037D3A7D2